GPPAVRPPLSQPARGSRSLRRSPARTRPVPPPALSRALQPPKSSTPPLQPSVDLLLIRIDPAAQHVVHPHRNTRKARLQQRVGNRDRPSAEIRGDLRRPALADRLPKVVILDGDDLAVGLRERELVAPQSLPTEQGGGRFIKVELRDALQE